MKSKQLVCLSFFWWGNKRKYFTHFPGLRSYFIPFSEWQMDATLFVSLRPFHLDFFKSLSTNCSFRLCLGYTGSLITCCKWFLSLYCPKPSLKTGTANAICWNSLGLFRDYGLNHILLWIKPFCFSRQKAETFSICLKKNFVITKFNSFSLFRQFLFSYFVLCLIELKFCEVSQNLYLTDAENFSIFLK